MRRLSEEGRSSATRGHIRTTGYDSDRATTYREKEGSWKTQVGRGSGILLLTGCCTSSRSGSFRTGSGPASGIGQPNRPTRRMWWWRRRCRTWSETRSRPAYTCSDLFERRRVLAEDWARYLAGEPAETSATSSDEGFDAVATA